MVLARPQPCVHPPRMVEEKPGVVVEHCGVVTSEEGVRVSSVLGLIGVHGRLLPVWGEGRAS